MEVRVMRKVRSGQPVTVERKDDSRAVLPARRPPEADKVEPRPLGRIRKKGGSAGVQVGCWRL
jgi:hypothetical protein